MAQPIKDPLFHDKITRETAEGIIALSDPGTCIFRPSSIANNICATSRSDDGTIKNWLITTTKEGYHADGQNFESLQALSTALGLKAIVPSPAPTPAPSSPTYDSVPQQIHKISRAEAEQKLTNSSDPFLIRTSSVAGQYALSYKDGGAIKHLLVRPDATDPNKFIEVDTSGKSIGVAKTADELIKTSVAATSKQAATPPPSRKDPMQTKIAELLNPSNKTEKEQLLAMREKQLQNLHERFGKHGSITVVESKSFAEENPGIDTTPRGPGKR